MPRTARRIVRSEFFHVISQGIKKEYVFDGAESKHMYLRLLNKYRKELAVDVIAYCIMDNHVHLLLHSNEIENLSNLMHKLNGVYGMFYNRVRNRVGYVFRNRFKMEAITDDRYLRECVYYIHNNPVKAGICEKESGYLYSSYREYVYGKDIISEKWINRIFGSRRYFDLPTLGTTHTFLEEEEDKMCIAKSVVEQFAKEEKKDLCEIINDRVLLNKLLKELNFVNKISYRQIGSILNISRGKVASSICDKRDVPFVKVDNRGR